MLRKGTALLALVLWLAAVPAAASHWQLARTANFEVLTDLDGDDARQLATDLERFRHTLHHIAGRAEVGDDVPVRVYALRHRRQATRLFGDRAYAGFYRPGMHGGVAAIHHPERARWNVDGRRFLLHEYAHHYLRSFPGYGFPTWYDEGFAEFVSTFEFDEGIARLGAPPPDRLFVLDRFEWIGTEKLVVDGTRYLNEVVRPKTRAGTGPATTSDLQMQYALGWFLTHYLYSDSTRLGALQDYTDRLNAGEAPAEAFPAAFGIDFRVLDADLRRHWRGGKVATFGFRIEGADAVPEPELRSFPGVHDDFWIAEARLVLSRHEDPDAMREAFLTVVEASEDPELVARARLNLAELENDLGRFGQAAQHAQAVLDATPDDLRAFGEIARARLGAARALYASGAADAALRGDAALATLLDALEAAFESGAEDVHLRALHVQAHIEDRRADALPGLRSLGALQRRYPQHPDIQRWAALLYAEAGHHERALEALEFERTWARSDEEEAEIAALVEAVRAASTEAAEAPRPARALLGSPG
ncbi:MAG: hypothetical protein V2J02_21585 [Pseudomonadales bacterium]|jgi:tetratricopeptide (TPR) repeat protein|nr:hypothetical protein [Pseudomonadales bacterium]